MAELIAVDELRDYLIAQGVVQAPDAPPSTVTPSVWLSPRQGATYPRRDRATSEWMEDATVTLVDTGLGGVSPIESFLEEAFVDIIVRARSYGRAQLVHRTIRGLLTPREAIGGRKHWLMGQLLVERSFQWRREQPLPDTNNGLTYDRVQSFCLQYRVRSLTTP